ncbi:GNAT family N-acetyltransferase [Methylocystis sp. ATCC 49242]|uniref:GNAT family N-acetyltransferase n=1 Tax=Methylocystis sp. ATCC 49242 TaxID=622637 RepID=UPI0001F867D4|nr:GNAT family N-acetyltransferase [Methylocystis sp. ATCC 49242]
MTAALPERTLSASLRPRSDGDLPAMLDLWVASWRATFPEIDFDARRDWLTRQIASLETDGAVTLCLFADDPPALAGFVIINPNTGWLDQICVGPAHFGEGFGEMLMEAARAASPGVVRLDVNADNARAIRFYERRGFLQVGRGANTLSGRATIMMEWRGSR